jgi:hypothetical protein
MHFLSGEHYNSALLMGALAIQIFLCDSVSYLGRLALLILLVLAIYRSWNTTIQQNPSQQQAGIHIAQGG